MSKLTIEVVYAEPQRQQLLSIEVSEGATVADLLALARTRLRLPVELESLALGIFGAPVKPDTILKAHDRVELYRPLIMDAKVARIERAKRQKEV